MREIIELVRMSRAVGSDTRLVQAGGGNTSIKSDDGKFMFVKASGTSLAQMSEGLGYRRIELAPVIDTLLNDDLAALEPVARDAEIRRRIAEACADSLPGDPSVETPLHAFLGRCVVHIHPTIINGLLCANDGRAALDKLFADISPPPLFVEWTEPGLILARATYRAVKDYEAKHGAAPRLLLLQNHGIFIIDDDADAAVKAAASAEERAREMFRDLKSGEDNRVDLPPAPPIERIDEIRAIIKGVWSKWMHKGDLTVEFAGDGIAREMAANPKAPEMLAAGALTPDQLAYAHGAPIWLDTKLDAAAMEKSLGDSLAEQMKMRSGPPRAILARDTGLFVAETSPKMAKMIAEVAISGLEILDVCSRFGGPHVIPAKDAAFIEGWVYEEARRRVAERGISG